MTHHHTIPLIALIRATAALEAVRNTPVGAQLSSDAWSAAMRSHSELQSHLNPMLWEQRVEVMT